MKKIFKISFFLTLFILSTLGCTDPYALQNETFEDALVVEATLTNEFKIQEIKLSRTYSLEGNAPKFEADAVVYIIDNLGNQYNFEENDGKYISTSEFQAIANRNYQLHITTKDGKSYTSTNETLTTVNPIQSILPEVVTKEGVRGVQIIVNSFDPTNNSKYYRYEYEETNRITAPKWSDFNLKPNRAVTNCSSFPDFSGYFTIDKEPKIDEIGKVCYKTESSNDILLTSTSNLSEDRVNFPVRFISQSDYTIAERYSILVTQYIQSFDSFSFYNTLKKMNSSGSILSQNQPGFIYGNIKSVTNPNEKVIGFFDVSSVSKKRIFFNFEDLFPGQPKPKYYDDCTDYIYCAIAYNKPEGVMEGRCSSATPECGDGQGPGNYLLSLITNKNLIYYDNEVFDYVMVKPLCGDCTKIGSNLKPSFWID